MEAAASRVSRKAHAVSSPGHQVLHADTAEQTTDLALRALRGAGIRVTHSRRTIIDVLARQHDHLSAEHICALVAAADTGIHRATIYRTLDTLVSLGLVTVAHSPGGATLYHLASDPHGHEHLHGRCRRCGTIVHLPPDALDAAAAEVRRVTAFTLEPSHSTLVGVCAECTLRQR